jgi:voltage-gated potassium channel
MKQSRGALRGVERSRFIRDGRLLRAAVLLALLTATGATGYMAIEGMAFLDALYMTVITLSTVGFMEVHPLSEAGRGFTIGLIVIGFGVVFHAASTLAGFVMEGRLREVLGRRSMQLAIDRLEGHVIVCGFGRLGRVVCERLGGVDVVVIDRDASLQRECESAGWAFVEGSALEEEVLEAAGIRRARALVAATASDPDNVFIALSARELAPDIQIHARAESSAGTHRLELSGASRVISPHRLAGQRIANALVRPGVVEFLELVDPATGAEIALEEVVIAPDSPLDGLALRDLPARGLWISIIAIRRGEEKLRLHPQGNDVLLGEDRVIAVGDRSNLERLSAAATAGHP